MNPRVLYITYDGLLEPLGESQIVSYLERLAADSSITILSFEKERDLKNQACVSAMQQRLSAKRIVWVALKYHKTPPVLSTARDVISGIWRARRICRRGDIEILHARSYVPALIALGAQRVKAATFLFDIRGFWVDEKVEAGHWQRGGLLYRVGKWWERQFYRQADAVVSLTRAGVRAIPELGVTMKPGAAIEVISTCADLERFSPGPKDPQLLIDLDLDGKTVIGCVGTMHNWYMRAEMIEGLAALARGSERVKILLITRDDAAALRRDFISAGVRPDRLMITSVDFGDMPRHVRLFDAGLFFIRPSFAKRASAATKLAEFLGCGVPVVINDGVGDSGTIVRESGVGVVLTKLDTGGFDEAAPAVWSIISNPDTRSRCRATAVEFFDLDKGVDQYRRLYALLRTNLLHG